MVHPYRHARGDALRAAHIVFDRLWKDAPRPNAMRRIAYRWLAEQMQIDVGRCHMTTMSNEELGRVPAICRGKDHWDLIRWCRASRVAAGRA